MPVITPLVRTGMRAVFVGDSITNPVQPPDDATSGYGGGNAWWQPLVNVLLPAAPITARSGSVAGGARAGAIAGGARTGSLGNGVRLDVKYVTRPNETTQQIFGHITEVLYFRPEIIFNQMGVNDCSSGVLTATSMNFYDQLLSAQRTAFPNIPIVNVSVFCFHEDIDGAGGWNPSGTNTLIDAYNAGLVTLSATYSAKYVDVRSAYAAYLATRNLPAPGATFGFLTRDGVHPIAAGKLLASQTVYDQLVLG